MLVRESYSSENKVKWYVRFVFDVSIFIIVNVTLMNIIFGIIIDTFAALRDKKTKVEINKNTICFVCSLSKNIYDKTPQGYEHHVQVEHNIWNYLFYIYYIRKEDPTEYTGVDSYVAGMMEREDIFWFPIGKSLAFNQLEDSASNTKEKFNALFERIKKLTDMKKDNSSNNQRKAIGTQNAL